MKVITRILFVLFAALSAVSPIHKLFHRISSNDFFHPTRIVAGQPAKRHQFPYQVSLLYNIHDEFHHGCGGVVLNETRVLTAAHCKPLPNQKFLVAFGMLTLEEPFHPDVQMRPAEKFISHPNYTGGTKSGPNDIAIIVLSEPVNLTDAVQPATLGNKEDCYEIDKVLLSGWGAIDWKPSNYPKHLQYAELPRIGFEECEDRLIHSTGTSEPLDETQICTTSNSHQWQSACSADSGGPLVRLSNKKLIGIVAWVVYPCGRPEAPSMFTNICSHFDFINSN